MDELNPSQAREHLELVERILSESSQRLCFGGELFVVWGVFSGVVTLLWQLIANGLLPYAWLWVSGGLLVLAIAFTMIRSRRINAGVMRRSIVQREFLNVLALTLGLAFVVNVACFNLFRGWAQSGIWTFAEAVVLFFIGMHGNRRAQIAGILAVASMIVANFTPADRAGYVLAAGMVLAYGGFGLSEMFVRE